MSNIIQFPDSKDAVTDDPTFADACKLYRERGAMGRTDINYIARLELQLGKGKLELFTKQTIEILITQNRRNEGNKDTSIRRELNLLQAIFLYAHDMGMMENELYLRKPMGDTKREVWLTDVERRTFISYCEPEFRVFVTFLFFTGARLGEAINARWEDMVDGCFVFRSRKGKNKKEKVRSVPMHSSLSIILPIRAEGYVLTDQSGFPWSRSKIYFFWNKARWVLAKEGVTPHCARHTFASMLVANGVDLRTVAELLGHSGMEMVKRYTHLSTKHLHKAIEELPSQ